MQTIKRPVQMKEFIILMALLMSVISISIDALLPALGIIGDDLGVENQNRVQFLITAIFAGMAIGQLVCGALSDALGRKMVLFWGTALYLIGSLICYFPPRLSFCFLPFHSRAWGIRPLCFRCVGCPR